MFNFIVSILFSFPVFAQNIPFNFVSNSRQLHGYYKGASNQTPVLFLHGSPGMSGIWQTVFAYQSMPSNLQLIAVDRPGYGGSGIGRSEPNLAVQSEELFQAVRVNTSHRKPVVVGYSYGGAVAAQMVFSHQNEIACVVLLAGALTPNAEPDHWYNHFLTWEGIRPLAPGELVVSAEETLALPSFTEQFARQWQNIRIPVIIVQGLADTTIDPRTADFVENSLVNSSHVEVLRVPGLDHHIPYRRPDLVTLAIQKCL